MRGDGVAARCCVHLLRNAGIGVRMEQTGRPRVPAIMLSDPAVALIRDVFGDATLFAGLPRITKRIVAWGESAEAVPLPHSAIVTSERDLLETLPLRPAPADFEVNFTVYTAGPLPEVTQTHRFGGRRATAARVHAKDAGLAACAIESLEDGWLFLVPNQPEAVWLLAIGGSVEALLAKSRVVAPLICGVEPVPGEFSSCPRIAAPLYGENWLACGSVALAFDPICGDGTAQAVREGILAAALIRAIAMGGDRVSLLQHYESRLTAGMQRHLALCAGFYRSGGAGAWWEREFAGLREGFLWCGERLRSAGEPQYQLNGFELTPYNR